MKNVEEFFFFLYNDRDITMDIIVVHVFVGVHKSPKTFDIFIENFK